MAEFYAIELPTRWGPGRVAQVVDAVGGVYVLNSGARSEVLRLEERRLCSIGGPPLPPVPWLARPMSVLGDGTLAVVDREVVHLFDGDRWTRVVGEHRVLSVWGPSSAELFGLTSTELLQREGRGAWRPVEMGPDVSPASWAAVHGQGDEVYVVGTNGTVSAVAYRRHGRWQSSGCGAHTLLGVRMFGPHHVAIWNHMQVWVDRGGGFDLLPLVEHDWRIDLVGFVACRDGHTIVGGRPNEPLGHELWVQIGRLEYLRVGTGDVAMPENGNVAHLDDGSLALIGGDRLWISEPVVDLAAAAERRVELTLEEEQGRTVRVEAQGGVLEVDRRPVANREWARFVADCGLPPPAHWPDGRMPPDREDHPVVGVSQPDAERFARTRGMRLPDEHEWADVMRAVERYVFFPWRTPTAPTHLRTRSMAVLPGGPLELVGVIWEWTRSRSPKGGHIVRGGPWRDRIERPKLENRSFEDGPALDVGFRCVRDVTQAEPETDGSPYR